MLLVVLRELAARFNASRLSTRILLLSTLTSVIPMLLLTTLMGQSSTDANRSAGLRALHDQAQVQGAEIADELGVSRAMASRLVQEPAIQAHLEARGARDDAATRDALVRERRLNPRVQVITLLDRDGRATLSSDPAAPPDLSFGGAPEFLVARGGRVGVSDVSVGRGVPTARVRVVAPSMDQKARMVGAVMVRFDAAGMVGFQNPTRLAEDRFGMIVDANQVVVGYTGPAPGRVLYHVLGSATPALLEQLHRSGLYGDQPLNSAGMQALSQRLVDGAMGGGQVPFPVSGRAAETGYAPVPGLPWTVVVMQDEAAFVASLPSPNLNIGISFVFLAILLTVVVYLVTRMLEKTESQALNDDLTGLPNRRYLSALMARELERSHRNHRPLSVVMIDLDHFKQVNDLYGHRVGDEVLRAFSAMLIDKLRATDIAARYGGEEFVVVLPDLDKEGSLLVVEKLRHATESLVLDPRQLGSAGRRQPLRVTLSAGVASLPGDGGDQDTLVRRADQAMYLAKNLGRNQVIGFGSAIPLAGLAGDPEKVSQLVRNANRSTVEAMAAAIDARDSYTHGHSRRVAEYSALIATELGVSPADLEILSLGALLHDVGKIGVSDAALRKTGKLTASELDQVKDHPTIGHDMVQGVPFLRQVAPIILHHHENVDGTGYPDGIAGEEIPLAARIVKVADSFDAMTSNRTYHRAAPVEWALGELRQHAGRQFDASVVAALVAVHDKKGLSMIPEPAVAAG